MGRKRGKHRKLFRGNGQKSPNSAPKQAIDFQAIKKIPELTLHKYAFIEVITSVIKIQIKFGSTKPSQPF